MGVSAVALAGPPSSGFLPPRGVDKRVFWDDIVVPGGRKAHATIDAWVRRPGPGYAEIRKFMGSLRHSMLEKLTVGDVARLTSHSDSRVRTEHPLFDAATPSGEWPRYIREKEPGVRAVADFETPWTFNYLFHRHLEETGRLFRWSEYEARLKGEWRSLYYEPMVEKFTADFPGDDGRAALDCGFRYRAGCAFYSSLREIDMFLRLRDIGLPVRYFALADALYRIDMWCGRTLLVLYVENSNYRSGLAGRKTHLDQHLDTTGFDVLHHVKPKPGRKSAGRCDLYDPEDIRRLAAAVLARAGS